MSANNTKNQEKAITPKAIEFQPDALEIKNERLPFWIRYSVSYSLLFIIIAIVWASVCEVDVVVQAPGKIVTNESNVVMKPLERTVIKKIHVKISQLVKKGDVLITFDPTMNRADMERLEKDLDVLGAQSERLRAEFTGKSSYKPSKDTEASRRQLKIFNQKSQYFKHRCNAFDASIKELQATVKAREETLKNQKVRIVKFQKIEDAYRKLNEKDAVADLDLLQVEIQRLEMESAITEQENSLIELRHQISNARESRESFITEWVRNISEELVSVERELSATQKSYDKVKQLVEYVELRAPCDSVVHEIAAFPVGSAVQEAEALVTLIPLTGLELEAEIPPFYISKVHIDSEARVKLNAYPFQKHGTLKGVVKNISENTLQRNVGSQQTFYYRARLSVSGKLDNVKDDFRLIPGMEVQTEIKTGTRPIIQYVVYPLIKALDESIREP